MCVNLQKEYNKWKLQTTYLLNFFFLSVECECVKRELVTYVVDIKALPFLPNWKERGRDTQTVSLFRIWRAVPSPHQQGVALSQPSIIPPRYMGWVQTRRALSVLMRSENTNKSNETAEDKVEASFAHTHTLCSTLSVLHNADSSEIFCLTFDWLVRLTRTFSAQNLLKKKKKYSNSVFPMTIWAFNGFPQTR